MGYRKLPTLVRGDEVTAALINQANENVESLWAAFNAEHLPSGVHGALGIPRVVGRVAITKTAVPSTYSAVVYRSNTRHTVTNFGLSTEITPSGSELITEQTCVLDSIGLGIDGKTQNGFVSIVNVGGMKIELLSNSATDGAFTGSHSYSFAIFDTPYDQAAAALDTYVPADQRRSLYYDTVNSIIRRSGKLRAALGVQHSSYTLHGKTASPGEIAKESILAKWTGSAYVKRNDWDGGSSGVTLTKTGVGVIQVSGLNSRSGLTPSGTGFDSPVAPFVFAMQEEANESIEYKAHYVINSVSQVTVYLFKTTNGGTTWSATDGTFSLLWYTW